MPNYRISFSAMSKKGYPLFKIEQGLGWKWETIADYLLSENAKEVVKTILDTEVTYIAVKHTFAKS